MSTGRRLTAETSSLSFERFPRCEGNGLNLVSIQVSDKCAVIVCIVVFTYTGRAFVNPTISNGTLIETSYCLPVRGLKRDVDAIAGSGGQAIDRGFEAEHDIG